MRAPLSRLSAPEGECLPGGFLPKVEDDPGFHKTLGIMRRLKELGVLTGPEYKIDSPYARHFNLKRS